MKVLVSGFDPFGSDPINPSIEAVKRLPDRIGDLEIIKVAISTIAYTCIERMETYLQAHQPDIVINVGQAKGRSAISIERVAININDFAIFDNGGQTFVDTPIFADGENAYFSDLPIKRMYHYAQEAGFPVEVSNSAGTFVCNHVMYAMQYLKDKKHYSYRSGFIHIPCLPSQAQAGVASMELTTIVEALTVLIASASGEDMQVGAGRLW